MKKFQFPLERVLTYRKLLVEAEEVKYQQLMSRLERLRNQRTDLEGEIDEAEQVARQDRLPGKPVTMREQEALGSYRNQMMAEIRKLDSDAAALIRQINEQRAVLLEASRRYEVLVRYRDRARSRWSSEAAKEQENLAGELFLARWLSKRGGK